MHRLTHAKALVEGFFEWVDRQLEQQGLLPTNPLTKALAYARERRAALQVFLQDADVPIDTNAAHADYGMMQRVFSLAGAACSRGPESRCLPATGRLKIPLD